MSHDDRDFVLQVQRLPSFESFAAAVGELLGIHVPPDQAVRLNEDLGIDSLGAFEVLLLVEELADRQFDDGVLDETLTLGDMYRLMTASADAS